MSSNNTTPEVTCRVDGRVSHPETPVRQFHIVKRGTNNHLNVTDEGLFETFYL